MLIIRGTQDIYISKGDTKNIGVNLTEKTAEGTADYEMADREYLLFKLWDKDFQRVLRTLPTAEGESIVRIAPDFTADLCGAYVYSVDLMYANGVKETIIGKRPNAAPKFVVMEA